MGPDFAGTFRYDGVAAAYRFRPPYPEALLDLLVGLVGHRAARVLDLGAGEGSLARPLASRVDAVDAVDAVEPSEAMIAAGRRLPGGDVAGLSWHLGSAEGFTCAGPYDLVTIGAALHWFDLPTVARRLRAVMAPGAMIAVVDRTATVPGLREALLPVIVRFSRNQAFDPNHSATDELARRGLWRIRGEQTTPPTPFRQRVDDYIEALHSTATLARELLPQSELAAFDAAAHHALEPFSTDGVLDLELTATLTWGTLCEDHTS